MITVANEYCYFIENCEKRAVNKNYPLKASLSENLADIYQDMKDYMHLVSYIVHE